MKWFNDSKINMAMFIFVAANVLGVSAKADFTFGEPVNLGPGLNTSYAEGATCISTDGLTLFFSTGYSGSARPGGFGGEDVWMTTRATLSEPWSEPVNLGAPVNSNASESFASISADGLTLYFCDFFYGSARPGGVGGKDLWMSTRTSLNGPWSAPVNMGSVLNSSGDDITPTTSADGLTLIFASNRVSGGWSYDLWMSTRANTDSEWGAPVNMGSTINSSSYDGAANLSSDGLALFFASNRPGGFGSDDIWMAVRKTVNDPWEPPVNLGALINTNVDDTAPEISADGRMLYFDSPRSGGLGSYDLWQAPIEPIVDFSGDGHVDIDDLLIMINNWGMDVSLCDIGPMPWGDGIVDEADLEVLMSYWKQEINDPTLLAHWALDETEGTIAADSTNKYDGTLNGNPLWQPEGGMVDGALELDGIDDYIRTPRVLNPVETVFSVFVWIKGGSPGQVIVSQQTGANWLMLDQTAGCLMTELKASGRSTNLISQMTISDRSWHRVGLVWDGTNRILYVDDTEVASDTQDDMYGSTGGMYIGAGNSLTAGTFFSGLIDDIRIYNRTVTP
jgi:hypothetical protein